jgi:hypothetical protein
MKLEDYFQQPKFTCPRRLILMVAGPQKVGKTTLALSSCVEGLTAVLNYDYGLEGVINQFEGKPILVMDLEHPTSMAKDNESAEGDYKKAWAMAKDAYYTALNDKRVKSIVIDTASEFWESCRLAGLGRLEKVPPLKYGEVNAEMRKIIRDAQESVDKNLILLHSVKDEYAKNERTGNQVFSGFSGTPGLVQMVLEMWKNGKDYSGTIVDCRQKRSLEGTELPASILTFPQLLKLVHGNAE